MNRNTERIGENADHAAVRAHMVAELPGLLREVRARARRRRARAVIAAAISIAPLAWAAAYLSSARTLTPPDHGIAHADTEEPAQDRGSAGPDPLIPYLIGDDEFFSLMSKAGYDVGLVRTRSETIVVGFEPTAHEPEHNEAPLSSPGSGSLE